MPITVTCPSCTGQMAAPDHAAGKKGRCPKCGEILVIPAASGRGYDPDWPDDRSPYAPPKSIPSAPEPANGKTTVATPLAVISGRPATPWSGLVFRSSWFGRTTLTLQPSRLVEQTHRLVSGRECQILLTEVDSAEIITSSNPLWLVFGFATITLLVGVVFIVLYFVVKQRFLVIRSRSNLVVITVPSHDQPYRQFMETVLTEAERARQPVED